VAWVQLKSMQAGTQPRNNEFIEEQFSKTRSEVEDAVKRGDALAELSALRMLVSDFDGLKETVAARQRLDTLKNSPALKQALKKEDSAISEQETLSSDLFSELGLLEAAGAEDRSSLRNRIVEQMVQLKRNGSRPKLGDKRLPLLRAFSSTQASYIESGQAQLEQKHYDVAEFYFQLIADVSPDEVWPVLLLAETSAARGNRKQAISRLRQTVKLGLTNPEVFEKDSNLQSLRSDPDFDKLLSELKSQVRKRE